MPLPHWIVEEHIPGDRRPHPHVHVDHLYVAVVTAAARPDEHLDFGWFGQDTLADLDMFSTTRSLALALLNSFPQVDANARVRTVAVGCDNAVWEMAATPPGGKVVGVSVAWSPSLSELRPTREILRGLSRLDEAVRFADAGQTNRAWRA